MREATVCHQTPLPPPLGNPCGENIPIYQIPSISGFVNPQVDCAPRTSTSFVPGSLEEMIRGLSGTEIFKEDEREMGDGERQGEVKGLEHGVKEGGKVR